MTTQPGTDAQRAQESHRRFARKLPDRPPISAPSRPREVTRASGSSWWTRQPGLGLAGLICGVLPVALLLSLAAGGAEPSLLVVGQLVTFAVPVVAMIAFWWNDWPGTLLPSSLSGWVDTIIAAVAGVVLTVLAQAAVFGQVDLAGIFVATAGPDHFPTFPATLPLGGISIGVMLQLTLVSEGRPLRQRLGPRVGGPVGVILSWLIALALYTLLLGGRPFTSAGPDPDRSLFTNGLGLAPLLLAIGVWQVWLFVVWRGWPSSRISRCWLRLVCANALVLGAGAVCYLVFYTWLAVLAVQIISVCGAFIATGLIVGMVFEGFLVDRVSPPVERAMTLLITIVSGIILYVVLRAIAGSLHWTTAGPEDWVAHVTLNGLAVSVILHVAIGRRWPLVRSDVDSAPTA